VLHTDRDINELVKSPDFDPGVLDPEARLKLLGIDGESSSYKSDAEILSIYSSLSSDINSLAIAQRSGINIPTSVSEYSELQSIVDKKFKRLEELINKSDDVVEDVVDDNGLIMDEKEAEIFNIISNFKK
jgi:hypothetical protein